MVDLMCTENFEVEENLEGCDCDANLFYQGNKSQIDTLLAQYLADKEANYDEQRKAIEARQERKKSEERRKKGSKSWISLDAGNVITRKPQVKKAEVVKPKQDQIKEVKPEKKQEKPEQKQENPEQKQEKPEQKQEKQEKPEQKQEPQQIQEKQQEEPQQQQQKKEEVIKKEKDIVKKRSRMQDPELKSLEIIKTPELSVEDMKEVQSEHVDFYVTALDAKLKNLFSTGEEETEALSERGYYVFDRFAQTSEQSSAYILSSPTTSVEGEELKYYTIQPPQVKREWTSESMRQALDYLKRHKIGDLFRFLGAHLIAANPCDPIDFLINLLDNCLSYRRGFCEPPLLYLPKHIESLFFSMDPMRTGVIEMVQYHTGMYTLGIKDYNLFPEVFNNNLVSKDIFMEEALNRLKIQLDEMIQSSLISSSTRTYTPYCPSAIIGESA